MGDLPGAQPVDERGASIGHPIVPPAGSEFIITIRKLKRAGDGFDEPWCEIRSGGQLYRGSLRLLDFANGA
jgi:hypothetical protein